MEDEREAVVSPPQQEAPPVDQEAQEAAPPARGTPLFNAAQMRAAKEKAEREAAELRQEIERMKYASQQYQQDEDPEEGVLVTKKEAVELARREFAQLKRKEEIASLPNRLQSTYPDYHHVVTEEAIAEFAQTNPELAHALSQVSDPWAQHTAVYKALKSSKPAPAPRMDLEAKKFQENQAKPRSINSIGSSSPLGKADIFENGLTPELKKQLLEEMNQCRKRG